MGVEREPDRFARRECVINCIYIYITYDFFGIFPVVGLEVFVSSCEVLSIGRCEPGEGTQLGICHDAESQDRRLLFCIFL